MTAKWIKPLFIIAALYDFILGLAALLFFKPIYNACNVTLPNHDGYVQWGAAVVVIFGVGFWLVAQAPARNRDIIIMGILFKIAYAATVLGHFFGGSIPAMWVPFAWVDLVFLVLFIVALRSLSAAR
ncbi:MAG: hypothetical protein ACYS0G_07895 [Planctomycetota bacterium]|jgi:hypothetical protein